MGLGLIKFGLSQTAIPEHQQCLRVFRGHLDHPKQSVLGVSPLLFCISEPAFEKFDAHSPRCTFLELTNRHGCVRGLAIRQQCFGEASEPLVTRRRQFSGAAVGGDGLCGTTFQQVHAALQ